jgi:trk system potassium uptake protein TrkH
MDFATVLGLVGVFTASLGLLMLIPLGVSIHYGETDWHAFLISMGITFTLGIVMWLVSFGRKKVFGRKECFASVTLGWIVAAFMCALPFVFAETLPSFTDAFFESMSGLTTTGASVLSNVEAQPHGILFWRSLLNWLGGMGIIVLFIAVLPNIGAGSARLFNAEVPGPAVGRLEPRMKQTAKTLWKIYVTLSLVQVVLLLIGGMGLFDAVTHTLATMATGGFSTKHNSIAHWTSPFIQFTIVLFMFIAGINFSLHFQVFRGRIRDLFRNEEFQWYTGIILVASVVIGLDLFLRGYLPLAEALGQSVFQVVSIITTTGFATSNFELWSPLSKGILFLLMFIGGCGGSTAGSMKAGRVLVFFKQAFKEVASSVNPNVVRVSKLNGAPIKPQVLSRILAFVFLYLLVFVFGSLVMAGLGLDLMSATSSVAASLGNVGPGFGLVGPANTYALIPQAGKWFLSFMMLLGRLELFTVFVLFTPEFWRKF